MCKSFVIVFVKPAFAELKHHLSHYHTTYGSKSRLLFGVSARNEKTYSASVHMLLVKIHTKDGLMIFKNEVLC